LPGVAAYKGHPIEASRAFVHSNSPVIIDDTGARRLYYRKMNPFVPVEPRERPRHPRSPTAEKRDDCAHHLPRRHIPGMARECADKDAEIMIRRWIRRADPR
jgi:formamidase